MACYSVILPTYNERENLPLIVFLLQETFESLSVLSPHLQLLQRVRGLGRVEFEIVVVDDNSPDKTAEEFSRLQYAMNSDRLRLLKRPGKLGLGTAYLDGLKVAKGNFIFLMDADFSHHVRPELYIHINLVAKT
ncbi:dolichol-phosphate mannosyltransferase, putative [Eimeria maxima]|uniref:dolichyl-phosphate beta-D-mannosyltransferase n=1 Tax=Eimeria maxima TaxID=5804 RepID=U6M930_EIMMA|nr:dolichol-phosphate mannosyltransferase, putative [Eimeria maxima]CDJ60516.1 dolichol-phosphate mannosyltransferase, putative [Eimeria maxima]